MSKLSIDYSKVDATTAAIKSSAQQNLKVYATTQLEGLKQAMSTSKGEYKEAIVKELEEEKATIHAAADLMIKLQTMIKSTADSYKKLDASYKNGAGM